MCESTGHRPLWGRCPAPSLNFNHNLLRQGMGTANHLTLLQPFKPIMHQKQTHNLICILQLYSDLKKLPEQDFFDVH